MSFHKSASSILGNSWFKKRKKIIWPHTCELCIVFCLASNPVCKIYMLILVAKIHLLTLKQFHTTSVTPESFTWLTEFQDWLWRFQVLTLFLSPGAAATSMFEILRVDHPQQMVIICNYLFTGANLRVAILFAPWLSLQTPWAPGCVALLHASSFPEKHVDM